MKTVAFSKPQVDAGEIEWHVADDRKRHTSRGHTAVALVTVSGAIAAMILGEGNLILLATKGAVAAFIASGVTAAYINSDHKVFYRRGSSLGLDRG